MIAQRVSAGVRPPVKPAPEGRQNSFPCDRQHSVASPEANAPEHEADKPQSLEAAKRPVLAEQEPR